MEYRDDYGFDRFLEQGGAASDLDVAKFVGKALFKDSISPFFRRQLRMQYSVGQKSEGRCDVWQEL